MRKGKHWAKINLYVFFGCWNGENYIEPNARSMVEDSGKGAELWIYIQRDTNSNGMTNTSLYESWEKKLLRLTYHTWATWGTASRKNCIRHAKFETWSIFFIEPVYLCTSPYTTRAWNTINWCRWE